MSKTVEEVGMIAVGVALMVATYGAASGATVAIWGMTFSESTLFAVGLSAGITGSFGLLQSILNPNDTSVPGSQSNAQESAAYAPRGLRRGRSGRRQDLRQRARREEQLYQNLGPQNNLRHLVFTLTGHRSRSLGGAAILCVIIDNILTELVKIGHGTACPRTRSIPGRHTNDGEEDEFPGSYHIGFEFDVGNPNRC